MRDAALLDRLLPGVDVVCHQAAMVGHGVDPGDAPDFAAHNDLGTAVLLAAMHRAGVRRLVLAASMVVYGEGRYDCAEHGRVRPGSRSTVDLDAGRYEPRCPACGRELRPGLVTEDAPADPRSTYAATKLAQEHLAGAWARQTGGSVWALRYHNVYGPRMPRDTPYAGVAVDLPLGAGPRRGAAGVGGRPAASGLRARHRRRARPTRWPLAAPPPAEGFVAVNVCSGEPHTIGELAAVLATADGGPAPVVVGGARPGDVRHVVAVTGAGPGASRFHRRRRLRRGGDPIRS